jgi:digeranylgeranylglycerophospholipid reductase
VEKHWDAVIIGGGPAGSTVAKYAAKEGAKVLVIDSRDKIGSPLQCGELVPTNNQLRKLCPHVPEINDLFDLPEEAISRRTTKMGLVTPSGKKLIYPFKGKILNRPIHDQSLVESAKEAGAKFLTKSKVVDIKDNIVYLANGTKFSGKIIVGCGGPHDPLRAKYWDEKSLNIFVKFMLIEGNFEDQVDLYFGSTAPGGYAWVIPKKNGANIGIGIQKKYSKSVNLKAKAEEFFSQFKGKVTYKGSGALPMSGTISQFTKGNYMLAGDSAGMVLPSNGAGITTAMIGGRVAGQAIANHIKNGSSLTEYEHNWEKQMGKMMKYSKRGIKWGEIMFNSPDWLVDATFNSLSKPFIWRAVNCRPVLGIY